MKKIRLIRDGARAAAANMAVDETLLRHAEASPSLRFYTWSSPACSVGYFQDARTVAARLKGMTVVRRITGGGMVVHGTDLTFSLAIPSAWLPGDVKSSYLRVNEALIAGLKSLWPAIDYAPCRDVPSGRAKGERVCFEAPACYDLMLGSRKVVGASQRRMGGALLHQSAVFLPADAKTLSRKIVEGFEKTWGAAFEERPLGDEELREAGEVEAGRYASAEWITRAAS